MAAHDRFAALVRALRDTGEARSALVEQAAYMKGAEVPPWTRTVPPLDVPHFATDLTSLRAHLLRVSPVPFKRRNIFVDASVGARV